MTIIRGTHMVNTITMQKYLLIIQFIDDGRDCTSWL